MKWCCCFVSKNDGDYVEDTVRRSTKNSVYAMDKLNRDDNDNENGRKRGSLEGGGDGYDSRKSSGARSFSFMELAVASQNFREANLIGEGGFGRVHKGYLPSSGVLSCIFASSILSREDDIHKFLDSSFVLNVWFREQPIAIKSLNHDGLQGKREFIIEILMLSLLHHPSLVNLIGYCIDGDQRLLVYEYMPMGSLEDHLFDVKPDKEPLSWATRLKIAASVAHGLQYLHCEADPPVIYRDFKSSNILLDENFNPKLSDFGLAKLAPVGDETHVETRVMGTYGYCAPEYAMSGKLTLKSDIYSFGVVLLELITGLKVIDSSRQPRMQNLVTWSCPLLKEKRKHAQVVDPRLEGRYPERCLHHAVAIVAMCLQENANFRPAIVDIVVALDYLVTQTDEVGSGTDIPPLG